MKILNYGSLNIDHVYQVDHFVRAGETTSSLGFQDFCGGKGLNQSIALARAGAEVYHAGKIGQDGLPLRDLLREAGVHTTYLEIAEGIPTGHAVIQVDKSGQNCIIIHGGANTAIGTDDIDRTLSHFEAGDILLLQNEISNVDYAIRKARELGMRVALNPSPIDERLVAWPELRYVDWFILNEVEGTQLTGKQEGGDICRALTAKYPAAKVMLTLGKQGCMYYDGGTYLTHGIYDVPVVDTTAAGDTFTGYFLACVTEGLDVSVALELASKASSIAVNIAGASSSIPGRQAVEQAEMTPVG